MEISKKNFALSLGAAWVIGGLMMASDPKVVEKPVEVIKEVQVENTELTGKWRQLKTVDDMLFQQASDGLITCSQMFYAIEKGDLTTMQTGVSKFEEMNQETDALYDRRNQILKTLGY